MAAAQAAPDLDLDQLEYQVGGRWFPCVARIDPDHLIGVMRRAQDAPADQFDPKLGEWLTVVFGFIVAATVPERRDEVDQAVVDAVQADGPAVVAEQVAGVFQFLLASYVDHQQDEIRARIVDNERARQAALARDIAKATTVLVRPRTTLAQLREIQAFHGSKATGEIKG